METYYGNISPALFDSYIRSLTGRVWKLLPMKQEGCETLCEYIDSLIKELHSVNEVFLEHPNAEYFVTIVLLLHSAKTENDFKIYRREILRCCNLLNRVGDA